MNDTQKGKILQYCAEHGSITVRDAFEKLNINSPTKRISELRHMGYDVQTVMEHRINSSGDEVKFNRYFISKPESRGGISGRCQVDQDYNGYV